MVEFLQVFQVKISSYYGTKFTMKTSVSVNAYNFKNM